MSYNKLSNTQDMEDAVEEAMIEEQKKQTDQSQDQADIQQTGVEASQDENNNLDEEDFWASQEHLWGCVDEERMDTEDDIMEDEVEVERMCQESQSWEVVDELYSLWLFFLFLNKITK